jgi:hypothetical protein
MSSVARLQRRFSISTGERIVDPDIQEGPLVGRPETRDSNINPSIIFGDGRTMGEGLTRQRLKWRLHHNIMTNFSQEISGYISHLIMSK